MSDREGYQLLRAGDGGGSKNPLVLVKGITAASGGGLYGADMYKGAIRNLNSDANATLPDTMKTAGPCIVLNTDEIGRDTHILKLPFWGVGRLSGLTAGGGLAVVILESVYGNYSAPVSLDDQSSYTESTRTWTRLLNSVGSAFGGEPFTIKSIARVALDTSDLANQKYMMISRTWTVDAAGRVVGISAESSTELGLVISTLEDDTLKVSPTKKLNFKGVEVADAGSGKATITATVGKLWDVDLTAGLAVDDYSPSGRGVGSYGLIFDTDLGLWVRAAINEITFPITRLKADGSGFEEATVTMFGFASRQVLTWADVIDIGECPPSGVDGGSA